MIDKKADTLDGGAGFDTYFTAAHDSDNIVGMGAGVQLFDYRTGGLDQRNYEVLGLISDADGRGSVFVNDKSVDPDGLPIAGGPYQFRGNFVYTTLNGVDSGVWFAENDYAVVFYDEVKELYVGGYYFVDEVPSVALFAMDQLYAFDGMTFEGGPSPQTRPQEDDQPVATPFASRVATASGRAENSVAASCCKSAATAFGSPAKLISHGNDSMGGGSANDVLLGDAGNDLMAGNDGDDLIIGGGGNDRLTGGRGADILAGGAGLDVFAFGAGDSTAMDFDIVFDFAHGQDLIDLSAYDARSDVAGRQGRPDRADDATVVSGTRI